MTFAEYSESGKSFKERVRDFFTRPSNPKNMKVLGGLILVGLIIGLVGWGLSSQNGVFHSETTVQCVKSFREQSYGLPCGDPVTTIWTGVSTADFNMRLATTGANYIQLNPNSTDSAIALSQTSIGDLSAVSGKDLGFTISWKMPSNLANVNQWGFYLTTNGTLPTQHGYDPNLDKSVALILRIIPTGGTHFDYDLLAQKRPSESISSEEIKTNYCDQSGSAFVCANLNLDPTLNNININPVLNYTGNSGTTSCTGNGNGPGCSYLIAQSIPLPPATSIQSNTQTLPWFLFQSQQYYFGFYAQAGLTDTPQFFVGVGGGSTPFSPQIYSATPTVLTGLNPTIDTGGWIGAVGRFLAPVGNFLTGAGSAIWNTIGNPLGGLAGAFLNGITSGLSLFAAGLVVLFNGLGNAVGLGNLGTSLSNFFLGIGSFLTNVAGAIYANLVALVNFFTQLVSILGSLFTGNVWGLIINFLTLAAGGMGTILTGLGYMIQFGGLGINYAFLADWFYGMFMLSRKGIEGLKGWLDFNGLILGTIAKGGDWFIHRSLRVLVWAKQLIAQWL